MVKKLLKFAFGGLVVLHALNSYLGNLADGYEYRASLLEKEASGEDATEFKASHKYVPMPVAVYKQFKKVIEQAKRYLNALDNKLNNKD